MKYKNNWKERMLLMGLGVCSIVEGLISLVTLGYFNPSIKIHLFTSDWFMELEEWAEK